MKKAKLSIQRKAPAPAAPTTEAAVRAVEEQISRHEAAKRAAPDGIDRTTTLVAAAGGGGGVAEVPDIDARWIERPGLPLPPYAPPRAGKASAASEENARHAVVAGEALLAAPFRRFWSTALRGRKLAAFLASALDGLPRPWAAVAASDGDGTAAEAVRSVAARLYARLATRRESTSAFLTPAGYAAALASLPELFAAQRIVAACALFAASAGGSFAAAVGAMLAEEEAVARRVDAELAVIAPAIVGAFALNAGPSGAPTAAAQAAALLDAAATLASFLRVHPPGALPFHRAGIVAACADCHAKLPPLRDLGADAEVVEHCRRCLVAVAATVVWRAFFRPLERKQHSPQEVAAAEGLCAFLAFGLEEPRLPFLLDLARETALASRLGDVLAVHHDILDKQRVEYAILVLRDKLGDAAVLIVPPQSPASSSPPPPSQSPTEAPVPSVLAEASLLEQILDLFPDADAAAAREALRQHGNNAEEVISGVLEGTISISKQQGEGTSKQRQQQQRQKRKQQQAPQLDEPSESVGGGATVVCFAGKKPLEAPSEGASGSAEEMAGAKQATLARLERMEEEDERERIRAFERLRAKRSVDSNFEEWLDEFDDSLDEFVRYDFHQREGDALSDGESPQPSHHEAAAASPTKTKQQQPQPPQQQRQQQQPPQPTGGGAHNRGGHHQSKAHHQKDRSMRKRGMYA